ncbi:MAG: transglutaminase domain-containing protein [Planctomycetes bacterium]|nr:transglutaminase domain-containing protein [Planctomycetota bacterium]
MKGRLRYLHFNAQPHSGMDRWCLGIAATACMYAALTAMIVLFAVGLPPIYALAPGLFLLLPWCVRSMALRRRMQPVYEAMQLPISRNFISRSSLIFFALFLTFQSHLLSADQQGAALLMVLLFLIMSMTIQAHGQDGAIGICLVSATLSCVVSASFVTGILSWLIILPSAWLLATGMSWVHARTSRRRLHFQLRLSASVEESPSGLISRALLMAILVPIAIVVTSLGHSGLSAAGSWGQSKFAPVNNQSTGPNSPKTEGDSPSADPNASPADDNSGGNVGGANHADGSSSESNSRSESDWSEPKVKAAPPAFPRELNFGRALGNSSLHDRLKVRDRFAATDVQRFHLSNPLYLTCTTYDTFLRSGIAESRDQPQLVYEDSGDGSTDGWTQLNHSNRDLETIELEVWFQPVRPPGSISGSNSVLMPRLEPVIAVQWPWVRYSRNRALTATAADAPTIHYSLRAQLMDVLGPQLNLDTLTETAGRYTELPSHVPAWDGVLLAVKQEVQDMDLADGAIRGVLAHFRRNYRYELNVGGAGPKGMETFFQTRAGYCTFFATAATLCLREMGIPARIAAGYRVTRWDQNQQLYVAGAEGAHAWVEVPIDGIGWVPVDVTPSSQAVAEDWTEEVLNELYPGEEILETPADTTSADANAVAPNSEQDSNDSPSANVESDVTTAPNMASESDAATENTALSPNWLSSWQMLMLLISGVLLALRSLLKLKGVGENSVESDPMHASRKEIKADPYRQLLKLLAKIGFRKNRSQTGLEFANLVVRSGGEDFEPLLNLTWMRYHNHFGGEPEPEEYREELDEFADELRLMDPQ